MGLVGGAAGWGVGFKFGFIPSGVMMGGLAWPMMGRPPAAEMIRAAVATGPPASPAIAAMTAGSGLWSEAAALEVAAMARVVTKILPFLGAGFICHIAKYRVSSMAWSRSLTGFPRH
jgi:hypothetical protein